MGRVVRTPAIDADSLPVLLADHPVVVIHFWAPWNGHDLAMERVLQELIPPFAGRIEFRSFDVDRGVDDAFSPEVIRTINNVPAIACFLRGGWLQTLIGMRTVAEWRVRFDGWLAGVDGEPFLYDNRAFRPA